MAEAITVGNITRGIKAFTDLLSSNSLLTDTSIPDTGPEGGREKERDNQTSGLVYLLVQSGEMLDAKLREDCRLVMVTDEL